MRTPNGGYGKGLKLALTPKDKELAEFFKSSPRGGKVKWHLSPLPIRRLEGHF